MLQVILIHFQQVFIGAKNNGKVSVFFIMLQGEIMDPATNGSAVGAPKAVVGIVKA
jgi:hypothetical protein